MKDAIPEGDSYDPEDTVLTDAQVGDVLTRALELEAWVKDLKEYALTASLHGHQIAGWKAVEGRSSSQKAFLGSSNCSLERLLIMVWIKWYQVCNATG